MTENNDDMIQTNDFKLEQSESIKLIRGQRGSYGWEIKQLNLDINALEILNNEMVKKFGGSNENSGKDL